MASGVIRVVIIDDHEVIRDAVARMLGRQAGLEVVGQTGDPDNVIELVTTSRPDVALVDMWFGTRGEVPAGIEMTEQINARRPCTKVVAFTGDPDRSVFERFLAAGGAGFVSKTAKATDLLHAIREAAEGRMPIVGSFTVSAPKRARRPASMSDERLSGREVEVLKLIAGGFSSKEVGAKLTISATTVDTYRRRIAAKLGSRNRSALVRYALEHGLLD